MNNIIIGVVSREEKINGNIYNVISKNNFKYLKDKCSYIGIMDMDNDILSICDGVIIPGGDNIYDYHFRILDYCIDNNVPVLGICMGCQIIGLYSFSGKEGDLIKVDNHYKREHYIDIDKNSFLYNVLGYRIKVNSRHKWALPSDKIKYKVGAKCDNIVESIEYIDNDYFLLGIEWHPEDMDNMGNLYNYFLREVLKRKCDKDKKYCN